MSVVLHNKNRCPPKPNSPQQLMEVLASLVRRAADTSYEIVAPPAQLQVGGALQQYWKKWWDAGAKQKIINVLLFSYYIIFTISHLWFRNLQSYHPTVQDPWRLRHFKEKWTSCCWKMQWRSSRMGSLHFAVKHSWWRRHPKWACSKWEQPNTCQSNTQHWQK